MKKLKKLKANLKNLNSNFCVIFLLLAGNSIMAQKTVCSHEQNKKRIDTLINKVVNLTDETYSVQSLLDTNMELKRKLASNDSLIKVLKSKLENENFKPVASNSKQLSNNGFGICIVIGAYKTENAAIIYKAFHSLDEYEIIKSKNGKQFYIAHSIKEGEDVGQVYKQIFKSRKSKAWLTTFKN